MKATLRKILLGAAAWGLASTGGVLGRSPPQPRPDVIVIIADDLGYSDLGAFGSEIRTPALDRLAAESTRLTNFHVAPACSPTRAELLTGVDHHRTGFGTFAEMIQDNQRGHPGYEGQLSPALPTLAERLRDTGYATLMAGKWHLGTAAFANPASRGFQRSFALLGGGANHFARAKDGSAKFAETYTEDGQKVASLPAEFYSSDFFTSRLIDFIAETPLDRPLFGYLAFTAPHYPLQAPPQDIARYRGRYDGGWAVLYKARFEAVRNLGLAPGARFDDALHRKLERDWAALSLADRALSSRKMETYAAMIDRLDQNVARLVAHLKSAGRYDNTIILFLSDNGPEGTELERSDHNRATGQAILAGSDGSLAALGTASSYSWYGPGWAHASAAPFAMFKHYPLEGGVRVPAILRLPGTPPQIDTRYRSVLGVSNAVMQWIGYGRSTGTAAASALAAPVHDGGELWGRRGYREGRWKAVFVPQPDGAGTWQLYDLETDPSETTDRAADRPIIVNRLIAAWQRYAQRNGVILPEVPGL